MMQMVIANHVSGFPYLQRIVIQSYRSEWSGLITKIQVKSQR